MNLEDDLYSGYSQLKGFSWSRDSELTNVGSWLEPLVPPGSAVLDFGFGSGSVLRWAKGRGCSAAGVERLPEMVADAQACGFRATLKMSDIDQVQDRIIAVDVLEHLSCAQLTDFLSECRRLLRPGRLLIARFPNAASPFSGYYQSGDATHVLALSAAALIQRARSHDLVHLKTLNPRHRPARLRNRLSTTLAYAVRDMIELTVGYAYFGCRVPIDPNVAVVLQRI